MDDKAKKNTVLLKGFGFSNYRSVGSDPVLLFPLKKINFLIGANNSGKTNLLRFISHYYKQTNFQLTKNDYHNYDYTNKYEVFNPIFLKEYEGIHSTRIGNNALLDEIVLKLLSSEEMFFDPNHNICWRGRKYDLDFYRRFSNEINSGILHNYSLEYASAADDCPELNLERIVTKYLDIHSLTDPIDVVFIPAERDLFDKNKNNFLPDGQTIIGKLKNILHPSDTDSQARIKRKMINAFVSDMLGYKVELNVPAAENTINIEKKLVDDTSESEETVRSLENIGSGIHEVIYLAIVSTLYPNHLICMDEPEVHMHPRLLRKLINYLEKNTNCQYLFATHSNCFLDYVSDDISVFRVFTEQEDQTRVALAATSEELSSINNLLGNRASELLQSNCIIWVEGPSDRIYINYWIHNKMPMLVEGIDYSIMFYGGRLLSHITAEEDSDEKLIRLLRINRNSYIVIDSDRHNETDSLNPTKERVRDSFINSHWITKGTEIENYLPYHSYVDIAREIKPSFIVVDKEESRFSNRLKSKEGSIDKMEFARRYTTSQEDCDFGIMDLDEQIEKIVKFIKDANR